MRFTNLLALAAALGAVAALPAPVAEPVAVAAADANALEARDGYYPDKEKEKKDYGKKNGWGDDCKPRSFSLLPKQAQSGVPLNAHTWPFSSLPL